MTSIAICWVSWIISAAPCKAQSAEAIGNALIRQGNPEYTGNDVVLLPSAREKYAAMFQAIREAKNHVYLEYFIFRKDSVGTELIRLLQEKAQEGVEIRLIIDAYGNWKAPHPISASQLDSIRGLGIDVVFFDPIRFPWIPNMLHRDHRKIVVVDGRLAYTGGMNVADYYLHGTERTGPWRDMQIRLEGPVVSEFAQIFEKTWKRTLHTDKKDSCNRVSMDQNPGADVLHYNKPSKDDDNARVIVVNREPGKDSKKMRRAYVSAFDAAQHEISIVNPYPTNTRSVRRAMKRALRRGIRMRVMVSSNMDTRITPEVVAMEMKKMVRRGAEVYYYEGGFHHTKVITIDDSVAVLGTTNLDGRSLRYDYEVSVFVFSPKIVVQLDSIFARDLQQSKRLTKENFKQRFSLKRRFLGRLFQPIKGLL